MTSKKNSNKWRGSNRASRLPSNWTALRRAVLTTTTYKGAASKLRQLDT